MPTIHFGSSLGGGVAETAEWARYLEELGYESVSSGEHVMRGTPPGPSNMVLPTLAVAAGATTSIRLLSAVLFLPLYHPVMVAKLAGTLDIASGGRLTLGVGVGGEHPGDFTALGLSPTDRGARTNESLEVLRRVWTEEHVTHEGRFFPLQDVTLLPRSPQKPHPPIWVAGRKSAAMRRAGRYGDGWLPYFYSPEQYRDSVPTIQVEAEQAGRDLSGFEWAHYSFISLYDTREESARAAAARLGGGFRYDGDFADVVGRYTILGPVDDAIRRIEEYVEAGARHFILNWMCEARDVRAQMELAANRIVPYFR